MHKRGQAAMEFLMTYGWAVIAVLVVIGAMWYFDLNPYNLVAENCLPVPGFACSDFIVGEDGIGLVVTNTVPQPVIVKGISFSSDSLGECAATGLNQVLKSGEKQAVYANDPAGCNMDTTLLNLRPNKYQYTVMYSSAGSDIVHEAKGELRARMDKGKSVESIGGDGGSLMSLILMRLIAAITAMTGLCKEKCGTTG